MYNFENRPQFGSHGMGNYGMGYYGTQTPFTFGWNSYPMAQTYSPTYPTQLHNEIALLHGKIDELRNQILMLTELVRQPSNAVSNYYRHGYNYTTGVQNWVPVRMRENDSHLFMDLYLPDLGIGDVDVEVAGARIICRTRIPVSPAARWWVSAGLPRGLECFELPDGRIEFTWNAPINFLPKEVEASWREGFLCICITRKENSQHHSVKISKDNVAGLGRVSNDMKS